MVGIRFSDVRLHSAPSPAIIVTMPDMIWCWVLHDGVIPISASPPRRDNPPYRGNVALQPSQLKVEHDRLWDAYKSCRRSPSSSDRSRMENDHSSKAPPGERAT